MAQCEKDREAELGRMGGGDQVTIVNLSKENLQYHEWDCETKMLTAKSTTEAER